MKLVETGFLTSVQDKGRYGYAKYGVPKSGAMDQRSFQLANLLLGNDENDACLEWTFRGPTLQFDTETVVVLTGAEVDAFLNGVVVKMFTPLLLTKDDVLEIKSCKKNVYGYVGIKSGFLTKVIMNSRSFFKPITGSSSLQVGDEIEYKKGVNFKSKYASISMALDKKSIVELDVYKGVEFDQLSKENQLNIFSSSFTISNRMNRMAIQLEEKVFNDASSILSAPVLPGTVQLTPAGDLIVLMRDCQTTGGYPRVLQLAESAINKIAQIRRGGKCGFRLIEW
ncbi:biotin-dependent carboxyltransferase family protein [Aquimarina sp. 2201CG1-2-11]|uniref:5-oxoprolinase subunit C family protein n=1 Tax=Aquimarina discodermiae TaxID=3231043 RepID=UPI0034624D1A